jgi:hypothetical protein
MICEPMLVGLNRAFRIIAALFAIGFFSPNPSAFAQAMPTPTAPPSVLPTGGGGTALLREKLNDHSIPKSTLALRPDEAVSSTEKLWR